MPSARRSLSTSVGEFFAIDDDWERPTAPIRRRDCVVGVVPSIVGILFLALGRSVTEIRAGGQPHWVQWSAIVGVTMPMIMGSRGDGGSDRAGCGSALPALAAADPGPAQPPSGVVDAGVTA